MYRNLKDWAIIDDLGIEVHFVKENFVLSDDCRSSEKFMHGIKVLVAKSYIDNLSEEATKGMLEKARQGLWPSYAPLGYANAVDPNGRKVVIVDPEIAPLISLLFEWFASGLYSLKEVTARARMAGLKGRRDNKPVCFGTVHRVLRNRFYTGSFDWTGETYAGVHEPLVSTDLWEAVQKILDGRATSNIRADRHEFPFSGLIKCGHCGCAIVAEIKKARYIYYHCTGYRGKCPERYVRQEVFEEHFGELLRQLKCDEKEFLQVRQATGDASPEVVSADQIALFRRKGQLPGAPGTLVPDGIALLDMARRAHAIVPGLAAATRRQTLGLLISTCTWANGKLTATFHPPVEFLAAYLAEVERSDANDRGAQALHALKEVFHDPSSDTRRLIAQFNALARIQNQEAVRFPNEHNGSMPSAQRAAA